MPADFSDRNQKRITIPVELRQPLPGNDLSRYIIGRGHQIACRLLERKHAPQTPALGEVIPDLAFSIYNFNNLFNACHDLFAAIALVGRPGGEIFEPIGFLEMLHHPERVLDLGPLGRIGKGSEALLQFGLRKVD